MENIPEGLIVQLTKVRIYTHTRKRKNIKMLKNPLNFVSKRFYVQNRGGVDANT